MKAFEFELVLKDSMTVLKDGFSPGGLVKQTVAFDVTEQEASSPLFAAALARAMEDFVQEHVKVTVVAVQPLELLPVHLSPAIIAEYDQRCVFTGNSDDDPFVPTTPGTHRLPRATLEAMLADAEHQGNLGGDGVEDMPAGTRRAYRCLHKQLSLRLGRCA